LGEEGGEGSASQDGSQTETEDGSDSENPDGSSADADGGLVVEEEVVEVIKEKMKEEKNEKVEKDKKKDEGEGGLDLVGITGEAISQVAGRESQVVVEATEVVRVEVDFVDYDLDGDGFVDYVEWVVPHLSEQVYEIIYITAAEHLDSDYTFIEDVYDYVATKDGNFSPVILDGEYVRVSFEVPLDSSKDITIFARGVLFPRDDSSKDYSIEHSGEPNVSVDGIEVPYEVYLRKKRIDELRRLIEDG